MKNIAIAIQSRLRLKIFLPLLCLSLLMTWFGLFYSVSQFAALTGGLIFVDMQPMLGIEALFEQIRTYSDAAVRYYIFWAIFDYAWPLVTFTTVMFIAAWLVQFVPKTLQRFFWIFAASAYLTVLFDWMENTGFIVLVVSLPSEPVWLAQLTLGLHALKMLFLSLYNFFFVILLLTAIVTAGSKLLRR